MPKQLRIGSDAIEVKGSVETARRPAQRGEDDMAKVPDNPVLKMLREIRATLHKREERFGQIDKRFDSVDKKLADMSESLTYSLGFSMQANVRHEGVQKQLDALAQRVKRLEERV
jgi:hypothetical protein